MDEQYIRMTKKRLENIEHHIRFLNDKKRLTNYEKGQLHQLEEEMEVRKVEFNMINESRI